MWIRANEARLLNKGAVFKFGASSREYKVRPPYEKTSVESDTGWASLLETLLTVLYQGAMQSSCSYVWTV